MKSRVLFAVCVVSLLSSVVTAQAASLNLSWGDITNETGYRIERRVASSGTYSQLAAVAANVVTYVDGSIVLGTQYCYRVAGFNAGGNGPYSNEACGNVPVQVPPAVQNLVVTPVP